MKIEITLETFQRLERLAVGFDNPEAVIKRLLDQKDGKKEAKPELAFSPSDEDEFKSQLIQQKEAEVVLYKTDNTREVNTWKANRFTSNSSLRGNIWSGPLRGWKDKGIIKAELNILPSEIYYPDGDREGIDLIKQIANHFGITFDEASDISIHEIDTNESNDGLVYEHILTIDIAASDPEILQELDFDEDNNWFTMQLN
jgi:hypothetical protein